MARIDDLCLEYRAKEGIMDTHEEEMLERHSFSGVVFGLS